MLAVVAGVGCARGGVEGPHADARVVGVGGSASGTAMVGRGDRTVGRPPLEEEHATANAKILAGPPSPS
jgi:hypothetical protein